MKITQYGFFVFLLTRGNFYVRIILLIDICANKGVVDTDSYRCGKVNTTFFGFILNDETYLF